jgi:uncharacterized protein
MKKFLLAFSILMLFSLPACALKPDVAAIRAKAESGDARAQAVLGEMYSTGKGVDQDYRKAAEWWSRSTLPAAQYNVGVLYEQGKGVPKSMSEAAKYYRAAADAGFAQAQYNLGVFYEQGRGLPQDAGQAAKWYRKAANQGHADAQFNLAALYGMGKGVKHDDGQAYFWLSLVAKNGDRDAIELRERIAGQLSKQQVSELDKRVQDWKPSRV